MNLEAMKIMEQRERQIIVHSYIYYELNDNIISDDHWAALGKDLVRLRERFPEEFELTKYAELFANFDASTGYGLYSKDSEYWHAQAKWLIEMNQQYHTVEAPISDIQNFLDEIYEKLIRRETLWKNGQFTVSVKI